MFDETLPAVYQRLRLRAGLSQEQLAKALGVSRRTVLNYEKGETRPDPRRERALVELSGCSPEETVEIFCEVLSDALGRRVAIVAGDAMDRGRRLLRRHRGEIPRALLEELGEKIHTTGLLRLAFERVSDELETIVAACKKAIRRGAGKETGATGPARGRPVSIDRGPGRRFEDQ